MIPITIFIVARVFLLQRKPQRRDRKKKRVEWRHVTARGRKLGCDDVAETTPFQKQNAAHQARPPCVKPPPSYFRRPRPCSCTPPPPPLPLLPLLLLLRLTPRPLPPHHVTLLFLTFRMISLSSPSTRMGACHSRYPSTCPFPPHPRRRLSLPRTSHFPPPTLRPT